MFAKKVLSKRGIKIDKCKRFCEAWLLISIGNDGTVGDLSGKEFKGFELVDM